MTPGRHLNKQKYSGTERAEILNAGPKAIVRYSSRIPIDLKTWIYSEFFSYMYQHSVLVLFCTNHLNYSVLII